MRNIATWLVFSLFLIADTAGAHSKAPVEKRLAADCVIAANAWIELLDADQKSTAVWPFQDEFRLDWHYLNNLPPIYMRNQGLAFKNMTSEQRILGHELLRCGLSSQGYQKTTGIMIMESIGWGQLPDKGIEVAKRISDSVGTMDAYWLAIFGDPSSEEPWQWQLEGHHVAVNFTFLGDAVSVTPTFLGSRPNVIEQGEFAGWHALGYEKNRAFALLSSLDEGQLEKAVIGAVVASNIFTDPARLDVFEEYSGLAARDMSEAQQDLLWRVINEYVLNYDYEISEDRLAEIEKDGIDNVHFAWMGEADSDRKPIYFRVHGPSVLIEFANASNLGGRSAPKLDKDGSLIRGSHDIADPNHIHSIYLNPKRNFGRDMLRDHYLSSHGDAVQEAN